MMPALRNWAEVDILRNLLNVSVIFVPVKRFFTDRFLKYTQQVLITVECTKDSVENIAKCAATVSENVADVQIKNAETELEYDKTLMNHIFDSDDDIETLEKKSAIYTEIQNAKTKRTMEEEKSNITQICELIKQSTPWLIFFGVCCTAGVVAIIVAKEMGRTERYRIDTDARLEYERIHAKKKWFKRKNY